LKNAQKEAAKKGAYSSGRRAVADARKPAALSMVNSADSPRHVRWTVMSVHCF